MLITPEWNTDRAEAAYVFNFTHLIVQPVFLNYVGRIPVHLCVAAEKYGILL